MYNYMMISDIRIMIIPVWFSERKGISLRECTLDVRPASQFRTFWLCLWALQDRMLLPIREWATDEV
jgi:hypothetical protein